MAWPCGGCRKPRHGAGVARQSPRDPACDSWPHPCQLAAAARHTGRLAGPPEPARSPCGPARCGLGRPRMPLAHSGRMLGGRFGLAPGEAPEQRLAKRAKDLELAMNPALTSSPPRLPAAAAGCAIGRPGPRVGEESSDHHARRARRTRAVGIQIVSCELDHTVPATRRVHFSRTFVGELGRGAVLRSLSRCLGGI